MDNKQLLLLLFSLLGISLLFLLSFILQPTSIKINQIDDTFINKIVKLQGYASSFRLLDKSTNFSSFLLKDSTGNITIICNCVNFTGKLEVQGKVQEYNNKLQVQANKIIKLN
jgi:DNA/RNA endonuclease YhcR with UshA esterase domain